VERDRRAVPVCKRKRETNLSRYGLWVQELVEGARDRLARATMLRIVERREARNWAELVQSLRCVTDFSGNPWIEAVGLGRPLVPEVLIERVRSDAIEHGRVIDG
jgi:hypothetical protein